MSSEDKTSTRELVWLTRLRQIGLFDAGFVSKTPLELDAECLLDDCLPWRHVNRECAYGHGVRGRKGMWEPDTPIL